MTEKKYYKEVKCLACNGTGKFESQEIIAHENFFGNIRIRRGPVQCICSGCNGRGSQTVLERIDGKSFPILWKR